MSEEITDLEKVGLFEDGPYDTTPILERPDIRTVMGRDPDVKEDPLRLGGPFPLVSGHKLKAATNDWTFSPFLNLWEGVPYDDPGAWRRQDRAKQSEKNLSDDPFKSTVGAKSMNGLGTYYGTFIDEMPAFEPTTKEKRDDGLKGVANLLTNPGKKGTGYGYADVTINPYPLHEEDPYFDVSAARHESNIQHQAAIIGDGVFVPPGHVNEYFDPNPFVNDRDPDGEQETYDLDHLVKKEGDNGDRGLWIPANPTKIINGNKDVMDPFVRFPPHDPIDPYQDPPAFSFRKGKKLDPDQSSWKPSIGFKTRQTRSVIGYNISLRVNPTNFHRYC